VAEADWETVVMPAKRAKGSVGEGEAGKKAKATQHAGGQSVSREGHGFLAMEFKSFYSEIQDTQVDVLHQDASVHQPSALSDLLGISTSMDANVDSVEARAECLHESAAGAP